MFSNYTDGQSQKFHNIHYSQQIPTKDQQIYTLKSTINSLQSHNNQLNQQKKHLKEKIKVMVSQVSNYHQNVVQKAQKQNQQLKKQINQCKNIIKDNVSTISKLTGFVKQLQQKNQQIRQRQSLLKDKIQYLQTQIQQLTQRWNYAQQTTRGLTRKQTQLLFLKNQLQTKNKYLEQQLNILNKKYQKMILCSQRSKVQTQDYIQRNKFLKLQQKCKKLQEQIQKTSQINKFLRRNLQLCEFQKIDAIQSLQNIRIQIQKLKCNVEMDIQNLKACIKLQLFSNDLNCQLNNNFQQQFQNSCEFKSEYRNIFNQIMSQVNSFIVQKQLQKEQLQLCRSNILKIETEKKISDSIIVELQQKINILKSLQQTKQQQIINDYQIKITKIQTQIKKQQNYLSKYSLMEKQLNDLKFQYAQFCLNKQYNQNSTNQKILKLSQQLDLLQQLSLKTSQQLTYQTQRSSHLPSLFQIISNFLNVIHYLHSLILRLRQRNRKVYMPFIDYYFRLHKQLQYDCQAQTSKQSFKQNINIKNSLFNFQIKYQQKKNRKLKTFRKVVQVVRSIIRMKKHLKQNKIYIGKQGYLRHVIKSIQSKDFYRNNKQNIAQLFYQLNQIKIQTQPLYFETQLLKFGKMSFSPSLYNFKKINLHEGKDVKKIRDLCYFLQENSFKKQTNK